MLTTYDEPHASPRRRGGASRGAVRRVRSSDCQWSCATLVGMDSPPAARLLLLLGLRGRLRRRRCSSRPGASRRSVRRRARRAPARAAPTPASARPAPAPAPTSRRARPRSRRLVSPLTRDPGPGREPAGRARARPRVRRLRRAARAGAGGRRDRPSGCGARRPRWSGRCGPRRPAGAGARCSCAGSSSWPAWSSTSTSPSSRPCSTATRPRRPDLVVHLAGGKHIVVDAKVPLGGLPGGRREPRRGGPGAPGCDAHATALRTHVDALAAKEYWRLLQPTPEFVVLFVPGEAFLVAGARARPRPARARDVPPGRHRHPDDAASRCCARSPTPGRSRR